MNLLKAKFKPELKKKEEILSKSNPNTNPRKNPSNGEVFKKKYGISLTMYRNMKKQGIMELKSSMNLEKDVIDSLISEYKKLRKARKKKEALKRREKRTASVTYKRLNGKKKGAKQGGKSKKKSTEVEGGK